MKQAGLAWISFPYSDFSANKIRPALVVSNDGYNEKRSDAVVCAITSNLEKIPYPAQIGQSDITGGKLAISSKIRADKIIQASNGIIAKKFAKLSDAKFTEAIAQIKKLVSMEQ